MGNVLDAISYLSDTNQITLDEQISTHNTNRINQVGDGLEDYIKRLFSGTIDETDSNIINDRVQDCFSYTGSKNHPPDFLIKNGDAIEVKKIATIDQQLQFNSSYPKNKLYKDDPMITQSCRDCEQWDSKDVLYAIGHVSHALVRNLWLIYGDCFSAENHFYTNHIKPIKQTLNDSYPESSPTKEIGRINNFDPNGNTSLRIRGMYIVDNPNKVFEDLLSNDLDANFQMYCLIREDKFNSFNLHSINRLEMLNRDNNSSLSIEDIKIPDPNQNDSSLIRAKLIHLYF